MNTFLMPRSPRLLAPWVCDPEAGPALYHCISRIVNREKVLGEAEKEEFVRLMRLYEGFCGVRVLTFCVMSNHFHLLVEVPPRPAEGLGDDEYLDRMRLRYPKAKVEQARRNLEQRRSKGDHEGAEDLKERDLYRMWDLGQFMKSLKQCFTRWFNRRHDRCGTLWEERYKSVLVEDGEAARVMGAYIDLNPVRAGMVDSPEQYRWCGYAEAMAGVGAARDGLARLMENYERARSGAKPTYDPAEFLQQYRMILFLDGEERQRENPATGKVEVARRGFSSEKVAEVLERGGELSLPEMLRCKVRALTDGAVFGTRKFLDDFFESSREQFGPKRVSGARKLRGCQTTLCCLRELRDEVLG